MATPTTPLTAKELETSLAAVVDQRSRTYGQTFALTVRFEKDDSRAEDDSKNFQSILRAFGFAAADEYVISAKEKLPGWDLKDRFQAMLKAAKDASDNNQGARSLILVHYAGHGSINANDLLVFQASSSYPRTVLFKSTFLSTVLDAYSHFGPDPVTFDVVFILDSYYSGATTRSIPQQLQGVIEVLAAVADDQTAFGNTALNPRRQNKTFTSKLADQVAKIKGTAPSVTFAELIEATRAASPINKPTHELVRGENSTRLQFPPSQSSSATPSPQASLVNLTTSRYNVVFSVHITGDITYDGVKDLTRWIQSLDPSFGMSVQGVYQCQSTGFILQAPFAIYTQLKRLPGIEMIFEATRGNRLEEFKATPTQSTPLTSVSLKENQPPKRST
ncbi:hypothetical protein FQN51_001420 [Onygenales sp. PD_10]|nr:hypothetical protein FQN51_001420 [Onygenales sp. PD_10]